MKLRLVWIAILATLAVGSSQGGSESCQSSGEDTTTSQVQALLKASTPLTLGPTFATSVGDTNGKESTVSNQRILLVLEAAPGLAEDELIKDFLLQDPKMVALATSSTSGINDFLLDSEFAAIFAGSQIELGTFSCAGSCTGQNCQVNGCVPQLVNNKYSCTSCSCEGQSCEGSCTCTATTTVDTQLFLP